MLKGTEGLIFNPSVPFYALLSLAPLIAQHGREEERLRQCRGRELLLEPQKRAGASLRLRQPRHCENRDLRLHRALLQPEAPAPDVGLSHAGGS